MELINNSEGLDSAERLAGKGAHAWSGGAGGKVGLTPVFPRRGRAMDQTVCKPGSVYGRLPEGGAAARRPFLWTVHRWTVLATYPDPLGQ